METELLTPDEAGLQKAAELIREGQVVGMPTETVYGLAADATNRDAVAKVFVAKGRPMDNPLIVHISSMEELEQAVSRVPELVASLADAFWPGPLTMIMPKSERIPMETSGGLDTVGVRMPSHPVAQALIRTAGVPIAAPSANRSGYPSPTTAQHVLADMQGRIPAILDGGACSCGLESTVVTFDDDRTVRILRPGFVTKEMLLEHVPNVVIDPAIFRQVSASEKVASPGMKYKHYAPNAAVTLVEGSPELFRQFLALQQADGVYALIFDGDAEQFPYPHMTYGGTSIEQGRQLFARLRELDQIGAKTVYVRMPQKDGVGLAVYNRLIRAAGFDIVHLAPRI